MNTVSRNQQDRAEGMSSVQDRVPARASEPGRTTHTSRTGYAADGPSNPRGHALTSGRAYDPLDLVLSETFPASDPVARF